MHSSLIRVRQYRRYFLWGLVCSLVIFGVSATISEKMSNSETAKGTEDMFEGIGNASNPTSGVTDQSATTPDPKPQQSSEAISVNLSSTIAIASLATSTASFLGFCFTAIVGWRRERREGQHSELDIEKKKLELEKLRRDLYPKSPPTDSGPANSPRNDA